MTKNPRKPAALATKNTGKTSIRVSSGFKARNAGLVLPHASFRPKLRSTILQLQALPSEQFCCCSRYAFQDGTSGTLEQAKERSCDSSPEFGPSTYSAERRQQKHSSLLSCVSRASDVNRHLWQWHPSIHATSQRVARRGTRAVTAAHAVRAQEICESAHPTPCPAFLAALCPKTCNPLIRCQMPSTLSKDSHLQSRRRMWKARKSDNCSAEHSAHICSRISIRPLSANKAHTARSSCSKLFHPALPENIAKGPLKDSGRQTMSRLAGWKLPNAALQGLVRQEAPGLFSERLHDLPPILQMYHVCRFHRSRDTLTACKAATSTHAQNLKRH